MLYDYKISRSGYVSVVLRHDACCQVVVLGTFTRGAEEITEVVAGHLVRPATARGVAWTRGRT